MWRPVFVREEVPEAADRLATALEWEVQGRVDTGGATNTLHADALCLAV
jgi:hypothetical protein